MGELTLDIKALEAAVSVYADDQVTLWLPEIRGQAGGAVTIGRSAVDGTTLIWLQEPGGPAGGRTDGPIFRGLDAMPRVMAGFRVYRNLNLITSHKDMIPTPKGATA